MKRLIVLSLSVTLLALQSGCSILNPQVTEPCDATSPLRSRMSQFRLRNLLPWRSDNSDECLECNEGFSEIGYSDGQVMDGQIIDGQVIGGQVFDGQGYGGQVIDGQIIDTQTFDGQVIDDGFSHSGYIDNSSYSASYPIASDGLYDRDNVFEGPVVDAPIPTRPVSGPVEQIPAPSPIQ